VLVNNSRGMAEQERREPLTHPPLFNHLELEGWSRDEMAEAAEAVATLMETPGWAAILKSIEDRLRFEQKVMMTSTPTDDEPKRERVIGQWSGLRSITAIAEGIVRAGDQVAQERAA
jgi:hypothetical protein